MIVWRFPPTERTSVFNLSFKSFSLSYSLSLQYWPRRYFHFVAGTLQKK